MAIIDLSSVGKPPFTLPNMTFSHDSLNYLHPPIIEQENHTSNHNSNTEPSQIINAKKDRP